ncbi:Similar to Gld: Glucose dehydrogenase [FAD [Cotesia congregata]|uniref:Quinone] (Drosophila melanogaster) n=1 Tax=Cotesia congregata TaxID=51543 RepID=A0A8J2H7D0_COTCN|nr:Similar to Gld: Glucose dehydrogenase [FAD [Cotesia congregata]
MDLIIKWTAYWIYAIAVFFFINYLNIFYSISTLIDYLGSNFENGQFFDYVIVGAGSAGITLAAKLADAGHKVVIIEAGGPAPPFADIPVLASLFQLSNYDWQYKTTSQKHACKALINNQSRWPMGKILGGSSRLNYMAYVEGHPQDYQWFADYKSYKLNGIKVISDLPVGQNLVDHILTGIDLVVLEKKLSVSVPELLKLTSGLNYFFNKQGPWTSAGIEVVGTLAEKNKPDLQFMVFAEYFAPLAFKTAVTIAPVLLHPKSTGEVKLKTADPSDDLEINPNYLSHPDDISILIKGLKLVSKLVNTGAMKTLGASLYTRPFPGCEGIKFGTDNYWRCYVQQLTLTSYHPAGTCKLGSVVDNSFRILGTKNLFVVDASILPSLPSGNINAAVMMIASKAADLINKSMSELNQTRNYFCRKSNYVSDIFNLPNVCLKSA